MSKCPILQKAKKSVNKIIGNDADEPVSPDAKLFELISHLPWDEDERKKFDEQALYDYVKQNPTSLKARYNFKNYGRGSTQNYPMFRIIALGSSIKTIQKVHKLFPPAMKHLPCSRITTLHVACIYSLSLDVIRYILEQNPDAIRQPTAHVFLPLHNACQATIPGPTSLSNVKLLVEIYPEALLKVNKLGDTPLKTAQRNESSLPEVIDYISEQEQDQQLITIARDKQQLPKGNSGHFSSTGKTATSSEFLS